MLAVESNTTLSDFNVSFKPKTRTGPGLFDHFLTPLLSIKTNSVSMGKSSVMTVQREPGSQPGTDAYQLTCRHWNGCGNLQLIFSGQLTSSVCVSCSCKRSVALDNCF